MLFRLLGRVIHWCCSHSRTCREAVDAETMLHLVTPEHQSRVGVRIWQDIASLVEADCVADSVLNGPRSMLLTVQGLKDRQQGLCIWACYPYCISDEKQRAEAAHLVSLLLERCEMDEEERKQLQALLKTLNSNGEERQLSDGS